MTEYDFLILSPNEFEDLTRDLLQQKLKCFIESFKTGRDGGIDLRYSYDADKTSIIQAKRYSSFASLLNNLKKEVVNVKKLNPTKYIVSTTVGLTPDNKNTILNLFAPYIKSTEDILGKNDLNNLISTNRAIEEKYYKLWISSINILNRVLKSKIINQSSFELEEINNKIKLFVQNNSFPKAIDIINNNRYIIISGIPGIGKTTLARMVTLYLLANEFNEFIYISDNIDDGYEYFNDNEKQIFLFDDFLGKNFFDAISLPKNDDKIVKFINKIKNSKNKVLILVTREYILNQAKSVYESFQSSNIEIAKCTLDLSTYNTLIKAKILYNHLFYGEVPIEYIEDILIDKRYKFLIKHKNYNPRIIETIIKNEIWNKCKPNQFFSSLINFFDNPESVWSQSFENALDSLSKYILLILSTTRTPILLIDLETSVQEYINIHNHKLLVKYDSHFFHKSIRELENTFVNTFADSNQQIAIGFQNPSINDFLLNHLKGKENLITDLICSFIYTEQFITIFNSNITIKLSENQIELMAVRLESIGNKLTNSKLSRVSIGKSEKFYFSRSDNVDFDFLFKLYEIGRESDRIENFIYNIFQENIMLGYSSGSYAYFKLFKILDHSKLKFSPKEIINSYVDNLFYLEDIDFIEEFQELFPDEYKITKESKFFINSIIDTVKREVKDSELSMASELTEKVNIIEHNYDLDFSKDLEWLEQREQEYDAKVEYEISLQAEMEEEDEDKSETIEEEQIEEIFNNFVDT